VPRCGESTGINGPATFDIADRCVLISYIGCGKSETLSVSSKSLLLGNGTA
jgi:hypothetical protein